MKKKKAKVKGSLKSPKMAKLPSVEDGFLDDSHLGEIAMRASRDAVEQTLAAGRPVTFWKDGRLYHQFPDGREAPVSEAEISEVIGTSRP